MAGKAHVMLTPFDASSGAALTSATVNVYQPGTVTPVAGTIYDKNSNPLSNPLTSDATTGLVDFYMNVAQEVDILVSKAGFTARTYSNVPVLDDGSNNLTGLLTTTGDIAYASAANTPARLAVGATGALLDVVAGIPNWLAIGALGQVLATSGGIPTWLGGLSLIATNTLGAPATGITFSAISGLYKHLLVIGQARGDGALAVDILNLQFNADTAANYDYENALSNSATDASSGGVAQTSIVAASLPGANVSRASIAAAFFLFIPNYAATTFEKSCYAVGGFADSTAANSAFRLTAGSWRNTAAITSVRLFPATSTNLVTGSMASLYGIAI